MAPTQLQERKAVGLYNPVQWCGGLLHHTASLLAGALGDASVNVVEASSAMGVLGSSDENGVVLLFPPEVSGCECCGSRSMGAVTAGTQVL